MAKLWVSLVVALVVGGAVGYWYGFKVGYREGKSAEVQKTAKEVNPFNTNPLGDVKINPFE